VRRGWFMPPILSLDQQGRDYPGNGWSKVSSPSLGDLRLHDAHACMHTSATHCPLLLKANVRHFVILLPQLYFTHDGSRKRYNFGDWRVCRLAEIILTGKRHPPYFSGKAPPSCRLMQTVNTHGIISYPSVG